MPRGVSKGSRDPEWERSFDNGQCRDGRPGHLCEGGKGRTASGPDERRSSSAVGNAGKQGYTRGSGVDPKKAGMRLKGAQGCTAEGL